VSIRVSPTAARGFDLSIGESRAALSVSAVATLAGLAQGLVIDRAHRPVT